MVNVVFTDDGYQGDENMPRPESDQEDSATGPLDRTPPLEPAIDGEDDLGDAADEDAMSLDALTQAENSRPTLPDETADGMDDLDEAVRQAAEEGSLGEPGDDDDRQ